MLKKMIIAGAIFFNGAVMADATVLTFDEYDASSSLVKVNNGYGGLNWGNMYVADKYNLLATAGSNGYTNGTVSGDNSAYNAAGSVASAGGSDIDFTGAYFTAAWNNGLNISLTGYDNGVAKYRQTITVDTTSPRFFTLNFLHIDTLELRSYGGISAGYNGIGEQFVMDDFIFTQSSTVPEPSTAILIGTGLAGALLLRRRRQPL